MRLSDERVETLQKLLKERTGRDYTPEGAQEAGLAIMRFVLAKELQEKSESEVEDERIKS